MSSRFDLVPEVDAGVVATKPAMGVVQGVFNLHGGGRHLREGIRQRLSGALVAIPNEAWRRRMRGMSMVRYHES